MKASELVFFSAFALVMTFLITTGIRDWLRKRRLVASLAARVQHNDEQFGHGYFRDPMRADIAVRVRRILSNNLKLPLDGLTPSDRLNDDLHAELPANPNFFWDLEEEFGIKSGLEDLESFEKTLQVLVTFQDLVEYVERKMTEPLAETPGRNEEPSRAYEFAIRCIPWLCFGGFLTAVAGIVLQLTWVTTLGKLMFLSGFAVWALANGGELLRSMIQEVRVTSFKEIVARPFTLIFLACLVLFCLGFGGLMLWAILKNILMHK